MGVGRAAAVISRWYHCGVDGGLHIRELAEENGVPVEVAAVTLAIQFMAVEAGCRDAREALEWAVREGLVEDPEGIFAFTEKGVLAAAVWAIGQSKKEDD